MVRKAISQEPSTRMHPSIPRSCGCAISHCRRLATDPARQGRCCSHDRKGELELPTGRNQRGARHARRLAWGGCSPDGRRHSLHFVPSLPPDLSSQH